MADTSITRVDRAINIVKDNACMINSICTKEELKAVGGSFADYLLRCLVARKMGMQVCSKGEQPEPGKPCLNCDHVGACGSTTRTEPCSGRQTKSSTRG